MALTQEEMTCLNCGSREHTTLEAQVDRGTLVRFRVCCKCSGFSHYLEHNEINRAVARLIIKRSNDEQKRTMEAGVPPAHDNQLKE